MAHKSERRRKELEAVRITRLDSRGRGRGVYTLADGTERSVAVSGTLPGDVVDVQVQRRKAGTYLGDVRRLITTEHPRTEPFCRHFGQCGGCTVQDLRYPDQLALKEALVRAAFVDAGILLSDLSGETPPPEAPPPEAPPAEDPPAEDPPADDRRASPDPEFRPILPAPRERYYRNKLEFSFGAQRWLTEEEVRDSGAITDRRGLGFHAPGRFDRVLDITECHLQPEPSESIRSFLGNFVRERGLTFYDARAHTGMMRLLMIRTALTGEVMVTVMFGEDDPAVHRVVMDALGARFPEITSLSYVVNTSANDSLYPHDIILWRGEPCITERCGENLLRIRPKAFYQTNPEQAVRLYAAALELSGIAEGEAPALVFDLYSGIGSIALFLARRVMRVVGIESVADAVAAARENATLNGITNAEFVCGAVEELLPEVIARYGTPELVMVDPPRAGMHPAARRVLRELAPPRIVYVSCNARTQATDIAAMADRYQLTHLQPVDMFPQTRHVENIAVLLRRDITGHL